MKFNRRYLLITTALFISSVYTEASFANGATIKVTLWDKGAMSMNMMNQGAKMGMGMRNNMNMATMGISASTHTVRAGAVTFEVTNSSKQLVHEMVISAVKNQTLVLPYDDAANKVDEDAAGHLGEVAELEPGKSGQLKITLKPGKYILYCNVPGHYTLGMWTLITVKN